MSEPGPCLEESTIWGFLHRRLELDGVEHVRTHLDACGDCRAVVATLARSLTPSEPDAGSVVREVKPATTMALVDGSPPTCEGAVLGDKYRVEKVLGRGGMGYVVSAVHLQLDTRVALKLLWPHVVWQEEARGRFLREARAAARIRSPHVVRVLDVDTLEDGTPFLVMELLEGTDLRAELQSRGTIPFGEAASYIGQAAHALAEAHAKGIVHRDLKPGNLFLARGDGEPTLKILDFGIAKDIGRALDSDAFRTDRLTLLGTPRYMAPEQLVLGRSVDARTDIWALGVVLHELIAGCGPFGKESLDEHLHAVLEQEPRSLDAIGGDIVVPAALARVVSRCLAKDPAARFASVAELGHALAPFVDARTRSILDTLHGAESVAGAPVRVGLPRRRRTLVIAACVIALGVGGLGATLRAPRRVPAVDVAAGSRPTEPAPVGTPTMTPAAALPVPATAPTPGPTGTPRAMSRPVPPRNAEFGGRR